MKIKYLLLYFVLSSTTLNGIKISILGNPGSGKSTLAKELHQLLNVPVYHLDHHYWRPNWEQIKLEEFLKNHNELCDKDEWIIEGMFPENEYFQALDYQFAKADIIIFFDLHPYICVYRILKRFFLNWGKDVTAPGCPEQFKLSFLFAVANFNKNIKPKFIDIVNKYKSTKRLFVIKSEKDKEDMIKSLI